MDTDDKDMSSNDRAFIKISKELLCLRNDLACFKALQYINARESNKTFRTSMTNSDEWTGLGKIVGLLNDSTKMAQTIKKTEERITRLEELSEVYVKGGDLVAARLAQE